MKTTLATLLCSLTLFFTNSVFGQEISQNITQEIRSPYPLNGTYRIVSEETHAISNVFLGKQSLIQIEEARERDENIIIVIDDYSIEIMSEKLVADGLRWID